jgi:hypothetical protein
MLGMKPDGRIEILFAGSFMPALTLPPNANALL